MDILYIHPPQSFKKLSYLIFPVGIVALINNLIREGYSCKGINYPLEKQLNKNFSLKKFLYKTKPKIVLIDFHWYVHFKGMLYIAKICKQINPKIKIIVGGYSATVFAEKILKIKLQIANYKLRISLIDYVIKGEGEIPLLELINCLLKSKEEKKISRLANVSYLKDGKVVHNPFSYIAKSLDKLNFTDLSFMKNFKKHFFLHSSTNKLIYGEVPTYYLVIGRGCPFNCYFCFGSNKSQTKFFNRNFFLKRKVENIINDIEKLKNYGVKRFHFNLDLQLLGKKEYLKFFKILREKKLNISLINDCFFIPDEIFISEFVSATDKKNSKIFLTLFCGSEKIRKNLGRNITNQQVFNFLTVLKKYSLNLEIFFQPNLPDESFRDFQKTIKLAEQIKKIYPVELLSIQMFPVALDPQSPYGLQVASYRLQVTGFVSKLATINNWYVFNYGYKNLSKEFIKKEQKLWQHFEKKLFYKKFLSGIVFKKRIEYFKQYGLNLIKK